METQTKQIELKDAKETVFTEKPPILERSVSLSRDGKWLILKTIRTDILHVNYVGKILSRVKPNE